MSFAALLRHSLVIEVPATGTENDEGHVDPQPFTDGATVRGLVQKRVGREIDGPDLGGTVVYNVLIFLPIGTAVTERNRLRRADTGAVYEVQFVKDAAGQGHHLEVDARRIKP